MEELINEFLLKNYLQEMRDNVTFSFENKPVFDKYLQLFALACNELQEVIRDLMQKRSIDTAQGVQLDIIGEIVGQPRVLTAVDLFEYFGYEGALNAESYGSLDTPGVGGPYKSLFDPAGGDRYLTDEQYRIFIKAKIMKNTTRATPEDIIRYVSFVFGVSKVEILSDENAHFEIAVSDDIEQFERVLLNYFVQNKGFRSYFGPKPLGVSMEYSITPSGVTMNGVYFMDNTIDMSGIAP